MILRLFVAEKRGIAGFTLVEILVAMVVFAIASLGLAVGVASVIRSNQRSYLASVATNLAQDKLEELKAKSPGNVTFCDSGCDVPELETNGVVFDRTWDSESSSPVTGVKRIDVTVEWSDHTSHKVEVSGAMKE